MPAKKGPILTGRKLPGKPGEGRGRKQPMPIKPGPKGGKNPKLPYRSKDEGFAPKGRTPSRKNPPVDKTLPRRYKPGEGFGKKRPLPVKPGPRNKEKELLYKVKPGEKLQKGFAGRSLNKEQMRKDTSPRKLPTPIKFDKNKMMEESYKNYMKQRNEKIRKSEGSVLKGLEKLKKAPRPTGSKDFKYLNMMGPAGPAPKRTPRPAADYMNMMKSGPIRKTKPVTPRRGGR